MATFQLVVTTTKKLAEPVSDALFAAGAQGLEERPGRTPSLVTYGENRQALHQLWQRAKLLLGTATPTPNATIEGADESWKTSWTEHLRPIALTRRLVLAPTTGAAPAVGRAQRLILYQPALAFGDGGRPTTRLAARAIESHYRSAPGGALLDIGAGTGVLSFVAVMSGARRAVGIDIAPEAVSAAQQNAELNGLARSTRFALTGTRVVGEFDLVVINIELRPLLRVLAELPRTARRAPRLLVTGFLKSQVGEVRQAVEGAGFTVSRRQSEEDWVLMRAHRA